LNRPFNSAVDIVYLWVNGSDPAWRDKRRNAAKRLDAQGMRGLAPFSNVEGRYRDNEELRYSLRALERFFPHHGQVYLVNDGQVPDWLAATPRLTVVDHRELIPTACLPTFDSVNIESYIHRIPNLSERYFYLNDDVFFGAPVRVEDWFWEHGTYVAWSQDAAVSDGPLRPDANSLENASRLSKQWLDAHPGPLEAGPYRHTFRTFAHAPRPMCKSVVQALEIQAPDLFAQVRSTVFRVWDKPTIVSDFILRWSLSRGLARLRDYDYRYVATGLAGTSDELSELVDACGALDFFCINDTTDNAHDHDTRLARVRDSLECMFPVQSCFERVGALPQRRRRHPTRTGWTAPGHRVPLNLETHLKLTHEHL